MKVASITVCLYGWRGKVGHNKRKTYDHGGEWKLTLRIRLWEILSWHQVHYSGLS